MKTLYKTSLLAMLALGVCSARADVVVVVGAKSPVATLNKEQVTDIFLGKTASFPSGGQAIPVDQSEGKADREAFYSTVAGKSATQLKAYWSKLVFSGKAQPPKQVPGAEDVKKLVADNPNVVGYIDAGMVDASVKVVLKP